MIYILNYTESISCFYELEKNIENKILRVGNEVYTLLIKKEQNNLCKNTKEIKDLLERELTEDVGTIRKLEVGRDVIPTLADKTVRVLKGSRFTRPVLKEKLRTIALERFSWQAVAEKYLAEAASGKLAAEILLPVMLYRLPGSDPRGLSFEDLRQHPDCLQVGDRDLDLARLAVAVAPLDLEDLCVGEADPQLDLHVVDVVLLDAAETNRFLVRH